MLFQKLSSDDICIMEHWIKHIEGKPNDMEDVLWHWNTAKEKLFTTLFGGKDFILKRPFTYNTPLDTLREEMSNTIVSYNCSLRREMGWKNIPQLSQVWRNIDDFIDNVYSGPSFIIPAEVATTGKDFIFRHGCKISKGLCKAGELLGIREDYIEDFRIKHSMVLNHKTVYGNLCLSIHPMDFMTLSDNASNWHSCMRWDDYDDGEGIGEYRLGTIEMMNSPCVLVAYIESEYDKMAFYGGKWNSKKWRQLVIVTPELILANRQYPFQMDAAEWEVLNWVKELAEASGFGSYSPDIRSGGNSVATMTEYGNISWNFITNFMYNDITSGKSLLMNDEYFKEHRTYRLNYSGVASCILCGDIINSRLDFPRDSLVGLCCGEFIVCSDCGCIMRESEYGDDCHYLDDGRVLCYDCWDKCAEMCDDCGEFYDYREMTSYPAYDFEEDQKTGYGVTLCQWCDCDAPTGFGRKLQINNGEFVFDYNAIEDEQWHRNYI